LLSTGSVPIVFFTAISLWAPSHGHFHWQAPGYLLWFPLLAKYVVEKLQDRDTLTLRWLLLSIAAPLVIVAVIGIEAETGWTHSLLKNSLRPGKDFTLDGMEWKELHTAIAERQFLDKPRLFVVTAHREEVGKVDLEIGRFLPVVCLCADPRDVAFHGNLSNFLGWDALVIGTDYYILDALENYQHYFHDIKRLKDIEIHRGGSVVLTLRVYYAKQYLGSYPMPFAIGRSPS
jgi:hypothetical protein